MLINQAFLFLIKKLEFPVHKTESCYRAMGHMKKKNTKMKKVVCNLGVLKHFGPWDLFWSGDIETF